MRDPETVVRDFCAAFARRDLDELLAFFTDDAVYHNIPMAPVTGKDGIREVLSLFVPASSAIAFDVLHTAVHGSVVLNERVDRFTMSGKPIELPVAGVFEVRDGKIAAWRDYFDFATWQRQTS
jgi:limonene-1,2-epoxide hydrolase